MYHTVETLEKTIHARNFQLAMTKDALLTTEDPAKTQRLIREYGRLSVDIYELEEQRDRLIEDQNKPFWKKIFRK